MMNTRLSIRRTWVYPKLNFEIPFTIPYRKIGLAFEVVTFYLVMPLLFFFKLLPVNYMLVLGLGSILALVYLYKDESYPSRYLFNLKALKFSFWRVIRVFLPVALLMVGLVYLINANYLWNLPTQRTELWSAMLIGYPLLSIIPQTIIYRAFFMHRYKDLIPNTKVQLMLGAVFFAFAHIVFHNWWAIGLTFIAGCVFILRFYKTRSLAVSVFEHTLYGNWLFTVGLGSFFSTTLL